MSLLYTIIILVIIGVILTGMYNSLVKKRIRTEEA